jgi:ribosomal protein S12 methylthiotransferase accessory factor
MSAEMTVSFPGGKKVTAHFEGFEIRTDQCIESGGDATAPEPFDYFLASLATCAGYYVLKFCSSRDISTDGISLHQSWQREADNRLSSVAIRIRVPSDFPAKYHKALVRAANVCSVKKTILDPPEITTDVAVSSS